MAQRTATRPPAEPTPRQRGLLRSTGTRALGLWLLLVLVAAACVLSVVVGARSIGLGTVWQALTDSSTPGDDTIVVRQLRVPRTVLGLLVGLASASPAR